MDYPSIFLYLSPSKQRSSIRLIWMDYPSIFEKAMKVFVSWSGGKDSCLALYRASRKSLEIKFLFSMLSEDGRRSRGHGLSKEVLSAQARALGIPVVYGKASWRDYEEEFKRVVKRLKRLGVEGGVFGDINLREHKEWVERVCSEIGIEVFEPLWNEKYERLLNEFLDSGFKAIIVRVRRDLIDEGFVGKAFDNDFIRYLESRGLDLCGERGEYHTLVIYGPGFKRRIEILEGRKIVEGNYLSLEIRKFKLI